MPIIWILAALWLVAEFPTHADPLDHWTIVTSPTTNNLRSVTFGRGMFVGCGDFGTLLTSSDGIAWTPVPTTITNSLHGVASGAGRFVVVGASGKILTSVNGVDWSPAIAVTANQLNAVAYTGLGFVAVGENGTIVTSSNGLNWVIRQSNTHESLIGIGEGFGETFVGAGANPPALFWSTDGASWSYMTNVPPYQQPDLFNGGFAFGNGVVLGLRVRGEFWRSEDGVTWTDIRSPFVYCFGLVYGRHTFVTVGGNFSAAGRVIGSSTNGISWQTRYLGNDEGRLLSVAYGGNRFVTVGDGGSILTSAPLVWLSDASVVSHEFHMTLHGGPGVYRIQATTNPSATSWDDANIFTNPDESVQFSVPFSADAPVELYRALTN